MKRIVILGGGESGIGSAILAKIKNFDVFISDKGKIKDEYKKILLEYNIDFEENKHTENKILNADEIIKSPGIPDKAPVFTKIKEKGINIISEIEFAGRYCNAKKICVTGSNGKTTTATLIHFLLKNAGINVGLAGNIGKSFAMQVATENHDYYVLELSSFQLDGMFEFKADIAVLLNITPDHLDRYDYKLENYARSKFRIIQNMSDDDCFIFCADDKITMEHIEKIVSKAKMLPFSQRTNVEQGSHVEDNSLYAKVNTGTFSILVDDLSLKGRHNIYNSMAAAITGKVLDIKNEIIRQSLSTFKGVEHRLEFVLSMGGIKFINDSKATNVNSVWYALDSINGKIIWIAGGTDKGNDYSEIIDLVKEKVRAIVCLGVDNSKIISFFKDAVPIITETHSAKDAVEKSYELAYAGDTVLLSPACASFDLFENYEDRGRQFKQAVRNL
ncbi:MAG: UDP-N-acetylmuramoyl-L-alanine--D-glutamate ligase [Prevotellaceae bacterium]|jgi:UDP-N-acetylmuramoylalanine--D-glutamate ligase|nr:UDP-N-acetylmuramoyl-L-alanine--D-glutamate ligase [Prevotellaceae bacterium]